MLTAMSDEAEYDADWPTDWRQEHQPGQWWAPRFLPGWMKALPGWLARGAVESRFGIEIGEFGVASMRGLQHLNEGLPDGQGRPVLLIPGFGFGDAATAPLAFTLHAAGYRPVFPHIVANVECSNLTVNRMIPRVEKLVSQDGGRELLVVGHSRGGMLARGLQARVPDLVDTSVALGSPVDHEFAFYEMPLPALKVLQRVFWLNPILKEKGCGTPECTCTYMRLAKRPLPAGERFVSIYTRTDGVVDWRACVVPGHENIPVAGTHLGMGLKPRTLRVVLEVLAQACEHPPDVE